MATINVKVNGVNHTADVEPRLLLVHFIREVLRLTGEARRLYDDFCVVDAG